MIRDRSKGIIELNQIDFTVSLRKDYDMLECRSISTPMTTEADLNTTMSPSRPSDPDKLTKIPYQNAVGSLLFSVQAIRPGLAFAVSTISKYNNCYNQTHWAAVKRILRYLQGTKQLGLRYSKQGETQLLGYCDASWATNKEDPRPVSGYVFTLQGSAISWNSRRQQTVAMSSTEAEYLSLSSAVQEMMWLRGITIELEIHSSRPSLIMCDNKGAIDLSSNAKFSTRKKHINVRHYFIKEKIDTAEIEVQFMPSKLMVADPLTNKERLRSPGLGYCSD